MRAPNPAELSSPFPNTEIANQISSPTSPNVRTSLHLGRTIGRASVVLTTISLASLGASTAGAESAHNMNEHREATTASSNYRLDNITRVSYAAQDVYSGRVTITTARRTKAEREPSAASESDAIAVGKMMGIPVANITQGKNSEISVGGRKIDLTDYTTTHRKAEAWTNARTGDCLWNFAVQDIGMASKKAGLDAAETKKAMTSVTNIKRVMAGYIADNPELKANPNLVVTGKEYVAKHAREEADELVAAMQAVQSPDAMPAPPAPKTAKPNPDFKTPQHSVPSAENKTSFKDVALKATKILSASMLALAAVAGAAGGLLGLQRRRHRRREEAIAQAEINRSTGKHRPPDGPGGGEPTTPPDDFSDLREITEKDKAAGHDPVDPPTGAHAVGNASGRSPYAPPTGYSHQPRLTAAPSFPPDIRARFGTPRLLEKPIDKRHLRSVPVHASQVDTYAGPQRPFGRAETTPSATLMDAVTDPTGGSVHPFRKREPQKARGWYDPETGKERSEYRGAHRRPEETTLRVEHITSRVNMHRTPHATDISVAAV